MITTSARSRRGLAAALVALWVCWGSSIPAQRVMVGSLPPLVASGAVFTTAGVVLAGTCVPGLARLTRAQILTTGGIGVCLLGAQGVGAIVLQHLDAGTTAVLVATIPLWITVLGAALGARPTRAAVARLALGSAGVLVVLLATGSELGWTRWGLLMLAAALVWAAATVWANRSARLPPARVATAVQLLAGGVALLVTGAARGETVALGGIDATAASWGAFAYLVLLDSLAGFALYNRLLRVAPASLVSTYSYAVPVVAYLVGLVVLGEPFRPVVLVGALAVLLAVAAEIHAQVPRMTATS